MSDNTFMSKSDYSVIQTLDQRMDRAYVNCVCATKKKFFSSFVAIKYTWFDKTLCFSEDISPSDTALILWHRMRRPRWTPLHRFCTVQFVAAFPSLPIGCLLELGSSTSWSIPVLWRLNILPDLLYTLSVSTVTRSWSELESTVGENPQLSVL